MQGRCLHWLLALVLLVQGSAGAWLVPTVAAAESVAVESTPLPPCHGASGEVLAAASDLESVLELCLDCSDCRCATACSPASVPGTTASSACWGSASGVFAPLMTALSDGHHALDPRPPIA